MAETVGMAEMVGISSKANMDTGFKTMDMRIAIVDMENANNPHSQAYHASISPVVASAYQSPYSSLVLNFWRYYFPLFNRKLHFSRKLGQNGTIMGMRNTIATLSNLIDSSCHIQNGSREGERSIISNEMKRAGVVDCPNANYSTLEGARGQLKRCE
ncbi:MAG: hypothetical protein EZS28_030354 [Streblomastix strix]|uniref:Uncharacterized protein n=1 Tax=Streblomastix strix TaxID=222440 RepID=A0A5J4UVJ0_9EUKA|nr:MAG: hypothetical protein EZS28_030354 [Streblomastix strix]